MNWYIVLYGAELAFSHQNVALFECEERALEVSDARKRLFSLRLVQHLVKNFSSGIPPQTAFEISQELQLPIRLVQRLIKILVESGLFLETMREGNRAYHLSCDINKLTITQVIEALDHHGSERLSADNSSEVQALLQTLTTFEKHLQEAKENKLLKDL